QRVRTTDLAALLHLELTTSATNPGIAIPGHHEATTVEPNPMMSIDLEEPIYIDDSAPKTLDHPRPAIPTAVDAQAAIETNPRYQVPQEDIATTPRFGAPEPESLLTPVRRLEHVTQPGVPGPGAPPETAPNDIVEPGPETLKRPALKPRRRLRFGFVG